MEQNENRNIENGNIENGDIGNRDKGNRDRNGNTNRSKDGDRNRNQETNREEHKYDDIIVLPRPVSARHPRMPLADRAAQFSPFAALTGHEDAIRETARRTEAFAELDEDRKEQIDRRLRRLAAYLSENRNPSREPEIEVTYFCPDSRKSGGSYVTVRGKVKKLDEYGRRILFADGMELVMESLFAVGGEWFGDMEDDKDVDG